MLNITHLADSGFPFLCIFSSEKLAPLSPELMKILLLSVLVLSPTIGLGCGLVYAATLTITCQYFDKRRGLALGIVTTGTAAHPLSSLGAHQFSMLTSFMFELLGALGC